MTIDGNPIRLGFFSLSGHAEGVDDDTYLRWHLLDHQPEQHVLPGLRQSTRWRTDDACLAARLVADDHLAAVRHAVAYLMGDPVDETLRAFLALAGHLREQDRMPYRAQSLLLGAMELVRAAAAPSAVVSAAAVPFRAHRGVLLVVEAPVEGVDVGEWERWVDGEHLDALLAVDGVAGAYRYRTTDLAGVGPAQGQRYGMPVWDPGDRTVTVVFCDDDPVATTGRAEALVRQRWDADVVLPELAAPLRSTVSHSAWPG
jgi:hypothetical protein